MSKAHSRRDLLKMSAVGAVGLAIPASVAADSLPSADEVEKELGHPMPDEARKLLKAALEANRKNGADRWATKLPDCSEPCFTYIPTGVTK